MREIKFRIFYRGKMSYEGDRELDNLALTFDGKLVTAMDTDLVYVDNDLENLKVMQYTGLHDKNGKEIYEGDIVQYAGINCVVDMSIFTYLKPIDRDAWFDLDPAPDKLFERSVYFEIIGNIYEHESLLTLTKDI